MPLRIGNYGDWSGDRRDPKKRPGHGNHPPACTCYACVEERRKVEARRIAEAADRELRYGPRGSTREVPKKPPKPPKPPKAKKPPKPPKPKRELPERTEEEKAKDARLGGIILLVLAVLAVLVIAGAIWGVVLAVGYVREQLAQVSVPEITVPSRVEDFSIPDVDLSDVKVPIPDIELPIRATAVPNPYDPATVSLSTLVPTLIPEPVFEPNASAYWDRSPKPTPAPGAPYMQEIEHFVFIYTNIYREQMGQAPLRHDPELAAVARKHSENMARQGKFRHELDGQNSTDRGAAAGYGCRIRTSMAENILHFPARRNNFDWPWSDKPWDPHGNEHNPESVAREMMESWIGSPRHRANLLGSTHHSFGVGMASDFSVKGTVTGYEYFYVTQKFSLCK